ncbi:type II/IV secretion system family protein, partial [Vibrio parahaemolyticus V-223/04]
SALVS